MCGLYSFRKSAEETRSLFDYLDAPDFPPRTYVAPGGPIAIVRIEQGQRRFALVRWGFIPSWVKELKPGKPLINARGETVAEKPSFRHAFRRRRCLIPVSAWAEAEGAKGRMTRTWYALPGVDPFAVAGLWRSTAEWGDSYTMVMTDSSAQMVDVHDRMPVILRTDDWAKWTSGSADDALTLCRTWGETLMVEQTSERWAGSDSAPAQDTLF